MSQSKPPRHRIGDRAFHTKAALREHIRGLLYSRDPGVPFPADDRAFLLALLQNHAEAESKVGCGVGDVFTRKHPAYGTTSFAFRRVDGSEDDFSVEWCLRKIDPEQAAAINVKRAAREAVAPSIRAFRDRQLSAAPFCAVTGERLARQTLHVDHAPPNTFAVILARYLDGRPCSAIPTECDDLGRCVFADSYDADIFPIFHDGIADLRLVAASVNLAGGDWSR